MLWCAVLVLLVHLAACATNCPPGWTRWSGDGYCYNVYPNEDHNTTTKVPLSFDDANDFCESLRAHVLVVQNAAVMPFLVQLVGEHGGMAWVGVRNDPANLLASQVWQTRRGRKTDFVFAWDTARGMPQEEDCVAIHFKGDGKHPGGNNLMITVECSHPRSVVCFRPPVIPAITAVNDGLPRRIEAVWRQPLTLTFYGPYIPSHTYLTLQSTTDSTFPSDPNKETHCSAVRSITGPFTPKLLNITQRSFFDGRLCNGTCQSATVSYDSSWPFVRGAKYSFCFFVPVPFTTPKELSEYQIELLGRDAFVEVVQKRSEYLQDVCLRRMRDVNMFYGDKRLDTNRDKVAPPFFDSPVQ